MRGPRFSVPTQFAGMNASFRSWATFSSLFAFGVVLTLLIASTLEGAGVEALRALPFLALLVALQAASFLMRKRIPRLASFTRYFGHLLLYGAFYANLHAMFAVARPFTVDAALVRCDEWMFGFNPVAWLGSHGTPILTDALALSYFSYYIGMPTLLLLMWRRNSEAQFRMVLSAMTIGWYTALVTYFLFPAIGPQRFMPARLPSLEAWLPTTAWIRAFLAANLTPVVRDCVPSMHTGITLLTLTFGYMYQRIFFWIYLPAGLGLLLATMYLQQHYAIDVVLGVLAFLAIFAYTRLARPQ